MDALRNKRQGALCFLADRQPVAGYMVAKRGWSLRGAFLQLPAQASVRRKSFVPCENPGGVLRSLPVYIVPFTDIQLEINRKCPNEQLTIIMRRMMMYIANEIADQTGSLALVTGESIGQVASQTMQSLVVTDDASEIPVFRPLIGMDKEEITKIAREIGTFETSILPYEDCCTVFTPKHPNTRPSLDKIKKSESMLDTDSLVKAAVQGVERIVLKRENSWI